VLSGAACRASFGKSNTDVPQVLVQLPGQGSGGSRKVWGRSGGILVNKNYLYILSCLENMLEEFISGNG
jgi:hypothetical protein